MMKLSVGLAIIGLTLLLLSALPERPVASPVQPTIDTTAPPAVTPSAAVVMSDLDYGRALFSAKGCAVCHHHSAVSGSGFGPESDIPDLSTYRWTAEYLHTWLKDPSAVKPNTDMPNLGLKKDEIEALIAFLSASAPRTEN
jgi:cytochrome c2